MTRWTKEEVEIIEIYNHARENARKASVELTLARLDLDCLLAKNDRVLHESIRRDGEVIG